MRLLHFIPNNTPSNGYLSMAVVVAFALILISGCAHRDYALLEEKRKLLHERQRYEIALEKFRAMKQNHPGSNVTTLAEERLPELKKKASGPEKKPEKLLTNVFFDTDIREIIRSLSIETGINLITDDTVEGILSVQYENLPLEEVLKMILAPGGYTFRKMRGYYLIGSADPRSPLFSYLSETVYVKPRFLEAREIKKLISPPFKPLIQVNEERNMLTITSSPEIVKRILEDINKVDKMPKQVMLEAVVIELSEEARKILGVDWAGHIEHFAGAVQDLVITFTYISPPAVTKLLTAKIHALVEDELAHIKATPRVAAMDGEEAIINIKFEQYIAITTGPVAFPHTTVKTIEAGVTLHMIPFILEEDAIMVRVKSAEVSDFVKVGGGDLPLVKKRSVNTTVIVEDNETIIIGGLLKKRDIERISRVPVLGYIPILGVLFSEKEEVTEESEVLIMITPRILKTPIAVRKSPPPSP